MKKFADAKWFKYVMPLIGAMLISAQVGYAQTFAEFASKDKREQKRIIAGIIDAEIKRLASKTVNGRLKSQDEFTKDRRFANYLRALYTNYAETKVDPTKDPRQISELFRIVKSREDSPNARQISIRDFFIRRASRMYDLLYGDDVVAPKKDFDSLTDRQQVIRFRDESDKQEKAVREYFAAYQERKALEQKIAEAKAERDAALKAMEEHRAKRKEWQEKRTEIGAVLDRMRIESIKELEISFSPSKGNPKIGMLVFKNREEEDAIPITFDLKCSIRGNKSKSMSVSISEDGTVVFTGGKNSGFVLGERCEIYYAGEIIRSYMVSSQ